MSVHKCLKWVILGCRWVVARQYDDAIIFDIDKNPWMYPLCQFCLFDYLGRVCGQKKTHNHTERQRLN